MTSSAAPLRRPLPPRPHALDPDVLLTPAQPGWEQARRAWNLAVDQRPSAIGIPRSHDDVIALIRFARERGLRVAPQATGHSAACLTALDGSLLLKTSRMRSVTVDPQAQTATVQAGALWSDVSPLAAEQGLAALAGSSPDVGVIGYTLGGGLSWLGRRYGLAANGVRRAEVVTGGGERLAVDARDHQELFWALRGGGGSYAVVTELEFELHPVQSVYAGALLWPLDQAAEILSAWIHWLAQAPDELTSVGRLLRIPPLPFLPPELSGREFVAIEAAYIGDGDAGGRLLAPLRALGPEIDTFTVMPTDGLSMLHMDPPDPVPALGDGMLLSTLTHTAIDNLLDVAGAPARSSLLAVDLRHLGGALGRAPSDGGAVASLDGEFVMFAVGMAPDPRGLETVAADVERVSAALGCWAAERAYSNFAERPRSGDELFGEAGHALLRDVKRAYDPDDVIQANHPVSPTLSGDRKDG